MTSLSLAPAQASGPSIALVEDDPHLREELAFQLQHFGFVVTAVDSAASFYRQLAVQRFAAVLLDIGLDGEDGLSVCRHLRAHDTQMSIVFVTARALRDDRIVGLQAGADAYFSKPVDLEELILLLRRLTAKDAVSALPTPPVSAPNRTLAWQLWLARAELQPSQGSGVRLSLSELQLLGVLCNKAGKQCSHAELGRVLGALPDEWSHHRLEVIISRLRQKVERQTGYDLPLQTVRGVGYMWVGEVTVHMP